MTNEEIEPISTQITKEVTNGGNSIRLKLPETFSDQQRVNLVNAICQGINPNFTATDLDIVVKNRQEISPNGIWKIKVDSRGNILVMNLNDTGNEQTNQHVSATIDQVISELNIN